MSPILPISSAESYVESAASQAAHIEQVKQLKRQLLLKQFELDTVLGVAHDMTARDHTVDELYHMLRLTLQGQRNVVQLVLFAREDNHFRARLARPSDARLGYCIRPASSRCPRTDRPGLSERCASWPP